MCASVGEDYSTSGWDVVVKVKPGISKDALLQQLRDFADALDSEVPIYQEHYYREPVEGGLVAGSFKTINME